MSFRAVRCELVRCRIGRTCQDQSCVIPVPNTSHRPRFDCSQSCLIRGNLRVWAGWIARHAQTWYLIYRWKRIPGLRQKGEVVRNPPSLERQKIDPAPASEAIIAGIVSWRPTPLSSAPLFAGAGGVIVGAGTIFSISSRRNLTKDRRARTSAWQSLRASAGLCCTSADGLCAVPAPIATTCTKPHKYQCSTCTHAVHARTSRQFEEVRTFNSLPGIAW